jgi:hypothetical protein
MAWRPTEWVLEGELDNTTQGWTVGWIRLQDRDEPLRLKLAGNCHPDLAGWKFRIVRTDPSAEPPRAPNYDGIATDQSGTIGDMTADQVLQHFDCSIDEFLKLHREGNPPPTTLRKALYLEWYSNRNGRVVIQSTRLSVERIGERAFELSDEAWAEQAKQNQEEIQYFMHQLSDALENNAADLDE